MQTQRLNHTLAKELGTKWKDILLNIICRPKFWSWSW